MNEIIFKIASSAIDLESVKEMRYKVFTIEQGIAHQLDDDGLDDSSIHILGDHQETGAPVVSGRLTINGSTGVISRIAVYKEYRGLKLGQDALAALAHHSTPRISLGIDARQKGAIKVIGITVGAVWIGDLGQFACGVVGTGNIARQITKSIDPLILSAAIEFDIGKIDIRNAGGTDRTD
jgi:hypothetical protein